MSISTATSGTSPGGELSPPGLKVVDICRYLHVQYTIEGPGVFREKKKGARKDLTEPDILGDLCQVFPMYSADAHKVFIGNWIGIECEFNKDTTTQQLSGPTLPEIGTVSNHIFRCAVISDIGDQSWVCVRNPNMDGQTYRRLVPVGDGELPKVLSKITSMHRFNKYFALMFRNPHKYMSPWEIMQVVNQREDGVQWDIITPESHIRTSWPIYKQLPQARIPQITTLTSNPKQPTFFYCDIDKRIAGRSAGNAPTWHKFDAQMGELATYWRAWFFSLFLPNNRLRQAMWLWDQGYSGKSTVCRVLFKVFGPDIVSTFIKSALSEKFAGSIFAGKHLVVIPDVKDPMLLKNGVIHSVLGNDVLPIEQKGVDQNTEVVYCKLLVGANTAPDITSYQASEISRVLCIHMIPAIGEHMKIENGARVFVGDNGSFEQGLYDEIWDYLFECRLDYWAHCPNNSQIVVAEQHRDAMYETVSSEGEAYVLDFVEQNLLITQDSAHEILYSDLCKKSQEYGHRHRQSNWFSRDVMNYLQTVHGMQVVRRTSKIKSRPRTISGLQFLTGSTNKF